MIFASNDMHTIEVHQVVISSAQMDSMAASCVDTVVGAAASGGWSVQWKKGPRSCRGLSGPAQDNDCTITIGNCLVIGGCK